MEIASVSEIRPREVATEKEPVKSVDAKKRGPRAATTPPPIPTEKQVGEVLVPKKKAASPPVPSRVERDRIASLSSGVAPKLAAQAIPMAPAVEGEDVSGGWPAPQTQAAPDEQDWGQAAAVPKTPQQPAYVPALSSSVPPPTPPPIQRAASSKPAERGTEAAWPKPQQKNTEVQPFQAADVKAIPDVPEAGLWAAVKYTVAFGQARWQRRGAIKSLRSQIGLDTGVLDGILGTLGKQARALKIETKALESENRSIDEAEARRKNADHDCSGLTNRQAEENSKFASIEQERLQKVEGSTQALEVAQGELGSLEAQRRGWKDKRKSLETRQKGYIKAAENRTAEAAKAVSDSLRDEMRHASETLRADASALDKECADIDRCLRALQEPTSQKSSRVDALKSDLDAAKRALTDLREGHRHRLAEIDAEQGRKSRELAQAEAEIQRRLVTLGTIVNLNRIDRGEFADLYAQIDTLRGAIGARSNEIDKLSAERHAFDKSSLIRGASVIGGAIVLFLTILAILFAAG